MADCPHCGTMNEEGAMTCTACGKSMTKDDENMGGGDMAGGNSM